MTPGRLGPYELLAPLGRGGAGAVFRARHVELGAERAVKVLASTTSAAADRFAREARALASVRHPNVVAVHETGVEPNGARWLAMELVPGEPLDQVLSRGPLPLDRALEVLAQVARGVEALHAVGIVHRDLKPGNVVLARDGRAVVVDLGLALSPDSDERLTRTGAWVGTARYVAPEQLSGVTPSPRTDVHALGLLVYEVTTGQPAFDDDRSEEVLARALAPTRPAPSDIDPRLPAALDALVRKAAATAPEARYPHAGDLADALERLRAAPGPSYAAVRRRRLLRLVCAGAALLVGALALHRSRAAPGDHGAPGPGPAPLVPSPAPGAPPPVGPAADAAPDAPRREPRRPGREAALAVLAAGPEGRVHVAWTASGQLVTLSALEPRLRVWEVAEERDGSPTATPLRTCVLAAQRAAGLAVGPGDVALALLIQPEGGLAPGAPAAPGALPGQVGKGALVAIDPTTGRGLPFGGDAAGSCLAAGPEGSLALGAPAQVELLSKDGRRLERFPLAADLGPLVFHSVAASTRLMAAASQRATDRKDDPVSHLVVWRRDGDPTAPLVVRSMTRIGALATTPRDPDALFVGWASGAVTCLRPLEAGRDPEHLVASDEAAPHLAPAAHGIRVRALVVSPDGLRLASAAGDDDRPGRGELRWWRLPASGGAALPLGPLVRLARVPGALAFSPDGRWLALGTASGEVELRAAPE